MLSQRAFYAGQSRAEMGLDNGQLALDLPALMHGKGQSHDATCLSDTEVVKLFRLLRLARRLLDLEASTTSSGT